MHFNTIPPIQIVFSLIQLLRSAAFHLFIINDVQAQVDRYSVYLLKGFEKVGKLDLLEVDDGAFDGGEVVLVAEEVPVEAVGDDAEDVVVEETVCELVR